MDNERQALKKAHVVIHLDTGDTVKAWFPDFPGFVVLGDRLADTIFNAPLALQQHIAQLRERGEPVPEPSTPDLWNIYAEYPTALIGFVECH